MLLRVVRCIQGQVDLVLNCEPAFDYGRADGRWEYAGPGWTEAIARGGSDDPQLRLTTDMRIGLEGRSAVAFTRLNDGESAFAALSWNSDTSEIPTDADQAWQHVYETADFWRAWLNMGEFPDHPWRSHLQRAALTLKGLTYAPTGALIAAPTTSLPETQGGERNWDYRYSWVRDATFALWGLYTLGFDFEANSFFYFIADQVKDGSALQVMYGVGGETDLTEQILDHLTGYEHSRPVRVGNSAHDQHQHDVWGALLDSVYLHLRSGEFLTGSGLGRAGAPGRGGGRALARARPGHLGDARSAAAFRVVEDHVLGRMRPGRAPRRGAGQARARGTMERRGRGDQGRRARARRRRSRRADADVRLRRPRRIAAARAR